MARKIMSVAELDEFIDNALVQADTTADAPGATSQNWSRLAAAAAAVRAARARDKA